MKHDLLWLASLALVACSTSPELREVNAHRCVGPECPAWRGVGTMDAVVDLWTTQGATHISTSKSVGPLELRFEEYPYQDGYLHRACLAASFLPAPIVLEQDAFTVPFRVVGQASYDGGWFSG